MFTTRWRDKQDLFDVITLRPVKRQSIANSVCVCVYVCLLVYLKNHMPKVHKNSRCLLPWLSPPPTTTQYVMYFRFCTYIMARHRWRQCGRMLKVTRRGGGRNVMSTIALWLTEWRGVHDETSSVTRRGTSAPSSFTKRHTARCRVSQVTS